MLCGLAHDFVYRILSNKIHPEADALHVINVLHKRDARVVRTTMYFSFSSPVNCRCGKSDSPRNHDTRLASLCRNLIHMAIIDSFQNRSPSSSLWQVMRCLIITVCIFWLRVPKMYCTVRLMFPLKVVLFCETNPWKNMRKIEIWPQIGVR